MTNTWCIIGGLENSTALAENKHQEQVEAELSPSVKEDNAQVQIPREIVDHGLRLKRTRAGLALNAELKKLMQAQKETSRRLRALWKSQDNELMVQELNQLDNQITHTAVQLEELKIPFRERLFALIH
jgi:hypothetical protein